MITELSGVINFLHLASGIGFLLAVFFAIRLYRETDRGWYWLSLLLSAIFFAVAEWATILFPLTLQNFEFLTVIQETSEVLAGLLFAVSCYGMYKTMKEIRKRVE